MLVNLSVGHSMRIRLRAYAGSEGPDQTAQSDQGFRCPLTELLDTIECMNGE